MGLKQAELAKRLSIKESQIQHMENGSFVPPLEMVRKLERFFSVKLIEAYERDEELDTSVKSSGGLTIGDMIKTRKRAQ